MQNLWPCQWMLMTCVVVGGLWSGAPRAGAMEEGKPADQMRALVEARYREYLDYLDKHLYDDPARAFSSRFDPKFHFDNEPFRALVALGPRAVPTMIALMQQGDKYWFMEDVLRGITKWRCNLYLTKDKPRVWIIEEFPDMTTPSAAGGPRAEEIWARWLKDVRKETPIWLEKRHAEWVAAVKAGNPIEAARKYERIFRLGIAALPAMAERIRNGEEDLIPVFSRLTDGAASAESPAAGIENWWKANHQYWELPEGE